MNINEISLRVAHGTAEGQQSVAVSTSSAVTTDTVGSDTAVIYTTVECFVVAGTAPTATVAAGTPIPANGMVRVGGLKPSDKLAFISASGTGTAYIRPGA